MAARKNPPPTYKNTGEWKPAFLAYLRKMPNVTKAAKAAGVERKWTYKEREYDAQFAADWDDAIREAIDEIEALAIQNARAGDARWQTMMIFMLKSWKPDRYKETVQTELTGPGGGSLTINVVYADTGPTDAE